MSETNPGDLPLAGTPSTPQLDPPPQPSTSIPELADIIASGEDAVVMRVATVSAVELTGSRRVQLDIANTTWVNRVQDCQLKVGDRVSVLQSGAVMLVIGRLTGTDAFTPIGAILPYGGLTAPTNYLVCDGSAVSRTTYAALWAVCGTIYGGGDGVNTFNLPDLRNRLPMGKGTSFGQGTTSSGSVTLSTANLPGHSHTFSDTSTSAGSHGHSLSGSIGSGGSHSHSVANQSSRSDINAAGGSTVAANGGGSTSSDGGHTHGMSGSADSAGSHTHDVSGTTSSTGSGTSFTTTGPYQAVNYIIRAL